MENIDFLKVDFVVGNSKKMQKNWVWKGKNQLSVFTLGAMA